MALIASFVVLFASYNSIQTYTSSISHSHLESPIHMALPHSSTLTLLVIILLHIIPPTLHQNISSIDATALQSIKTTLTDISGTDFFSTWDFASPDPCSTFSGITCSLNRVTTLTLGTGLSDSLGLAGSLSPSISNLTQLTQLILFPGLVTGPIPPQLGQLTHLRVISLTNNRLTGPIPTSLSYLKNLHTLDLSYNQLTGTIPPSLPTELPELKVFILASNLLAGELPDFISTQLLHLDLKNNRLTGQLKSLPSTLRYLSISDNFLSGPLNGLQSLTELMHLDLSMNQFNGPIPRSLFTPTLSSMFLQRNNLSGTIPPFPPLPSSSSYGEGSIVDLSHNNLTGRLPPALAGVESLFLNNNRFVGTVPEEYMKSVYLGTTRTLYLQHNYLSGFPIEPPRLALPDTVTLCSSYNCMLPPPYIGVMACPARSGGQISRPASQCSEFNNNRSSIG